MTVSPWRLSHRADTPTRLIADRHYNRQKPGTPQFVPPGRCLVLHAPEAAWVTSWPFAKYVRHAWPGAWINSLFRREGGDHLASDMIRHAIAHTRAKWPDVPDLGMVTFIDPRRVRGTKRRGVTIYGYSYLQAGFTAVGHTQGGLLAFQMLADAMPDPADPFDGQLTLLP